MSVWWDERAGKYRSTLPYKLFYVWGWPVVRWVLFHCMSSERAHLFALRAIPFAAWIDRQWQRLVLAGAIVLLLAIRLLLFLPGFRFESTERKELT